MYCLCVALFVCKWVGGLVGWLVGGGLVGLAGRLDGWLAG